jgi:hypothetical protein
MRDRRHGHRRAGECRRARSGGDGGRSRAPVLLGSLELAGPPARRQPPAHTRALGRGRPARGSPSPEGRPAASPDELAELRSRLEAAQEARARLAAEVEASHARIAALRDSWSWRLAAPLRAGHRLLGLGRG